MMRRRFLGLATLAGATGVAALSAKSFGETRTVSYRVQGFTCITCATGLETLLQREKGVLSVKASYSERSATVTFDGRSISPANIQKLIQSMGFEAQWISAESASLGSGVPQTRNR